MSALEKTTDEILQLAATHFKVPRDAGEIVVR